MENSFLITEDNLIGNIGTAILQLKKIREGKSVTRDISFFSELISFLFKAKKEDYAKLLYDKHFIVSQETLENLHTELALHTITDKVDFEILTKTLLEISGDSEKSKIDEATNKLREIGKMLWQLKNKKQIYM